MGQTFDCRVANEAHVSANRPHSAESHTGTLMPHPSSPPQPALPGLPMGWSILITPRGSHHCDIPAIFAAVSTPDLQVHCPADVIEGGLIPFQHL